MTINNGGPIGREQVPNFVNVGGPIGVSTQVSQELGNGNLRVWDMVVTGAPSGLAAAYKRVTAYWLGFAGVMETEAMQANPDLSAMPQQLDYGKPATTPIDLGSFGIASTSERVMTTIVHAGQPKPVILDVAVVEVPKALLVFGFLSSTGPPSPALSRQVIQTVVSRVS